MTTKVVRICEGNLSGQLAYVTYDVPKEDVIRVTPIAGDPLTSLEYRRDQVEYIWGAAHGPVRG